MFYPKMCFARNRSSHSFETCTIVIGMPENISVHWVWSSKYKEKWCFIPKCVLSETDHHTALKLCTIVIGMPENLRVHGVWPCKYKEKWCFIPKCVLSETDHRTALKLVPLWLACLKTSGCAKFGPVNTMESDVLSHNVFSQKQIIIQLWNLYHCDWHAWKPQGAWSLVL